MTDTDALARLARCYAHPLLSGPDADLFVGAIVAWEEANPLAGEDARASAWSEVLQLTC